MQSSVDRTSYPSDVSDEEWVFVAPYLALLPADAVQRRHDLREVFNALRYMVKTGAPWRWLPHDFPLWEIVYQQTLRWIRAGVFEAMVHDWRLLLRDFANRKARPTAAILDSRTLQSTPESGHRAGCDGAKRKTGSTSGMSRSTRWAPCSPRTSPRPATRTALRSNTAPPPSRTPPARVSRSPTSTRPIPGTIRPPPPVPTASARRSSSTQKPSAASCACPNAGWSSAASPGRPACAGSPKTMNACRPPLRGRTSLPSCASWLIKPFPYSPQVLNSL